MGIDDSSRLVSVATAAFVGLVAPGCLDKQSSSDLECEGGDDFTFSGADYCIYSGAIIIEGFDCPEAVPFQHQTDELVICSPTEAPPDEGWEELVVAWEQENDERPGGDTAQPDTQQPETVVPETVEPETVEPETVEPDTGPVDTGPDDADVVEDAGPGPAVCFDGLVAGECWVDSQCPGGWSCVGSELTCRPCVDCPVEVTASRGSCRPDEAGDALGLVAWPGPSDGPDFPVAYWWIANAIYTQLDCPSFSIEIADGSGGFTPGPEESACSGFVLPASEFLIVRVGPTIEPLPAVVRARGRYLTDCFGSAPESCGGVVELISNEVELRER